MRGLSTNPDELRPGNQTQYLGPEAGLAREHHLDETTVGNQTQDTESIALWHHELSMAFTTVQSALGRHPNLILELAAELRPDLLELAELDDPEDLAAISQMPMGLFARLHSLSQPKPKQWEFYRCAIGRQDPKVRAGLDEVWPGCEVVVTEFPGWFDLAVVADDEVLRARWHHQDGWLRTNHLKRGIRPHVVEVLGETLGPLRPLVPVALSALEPSSGYTLDSVELLTSDGVLIHMTGPEASLLAELRDKYLTISPTVGFRISTSRWAHVLVRTYPQGRVRFDPRKDAREVEDWLIEHVLEVRDESS